MDKDIQQAADFYRFVAWAHKHRKRLTLGLIIVLVIGLILGLRAWHKDYTEQQANAALMQIRPPTSPAEASSPALAENYAKVAAEHGGTTAGARALLLAGNVYFSATQYDKSRASFEQYLREYSDYPLTSQALVGVAACLEAQGNFKDAAAKYEEIVKRRSTDAVAAEAKSALARLCLAQGQPEQALRYYEELDRENQTRPDSWTSEAKRQELELLAKYPALRKPVVAPTNSAPLTPTLIPTTKQP